MSLFRQRLFPSVATAQPALAAFVLRVALGLVLLAHGLLKVLVFGLDGSSSFFGSVGLPPWLVYPVIALEVLGGLLIAAGLWVRPLAALSVVLLLGTVYVHAPNGWLFSAANGGWEYPLFLSVTALAVSLAGEGAYALRLPSSAGISASPSTSQAA